MTEADVAATDRMIQHMIDVKREAEAARREHPTLTRRLADALACVRLYGIEEASRCQGVPAMLHHLRRRGLID